MRQAIRTKYLSPTDTRGARIKAECAAGAITVGYRHELSIEANHSQAAEQLQAKFGWDKHCDLIGGSLKDHTYVFVQVEVSK